MATRSGRTGIAAALTVAVTALATPAVATAATPADLVYAAPYAGVDAQATYQLVAAGSGRTLEVNGASPADGATVQQATATGGAQQQFTFVATGGGWYRIVAKHSGKDVLGYWYGTANGTAVMQWAASGSSTAQWTFKDAGNGNVWVVNRYNGLLLDVHQNPMLDRSPAVEWAPDGSANQQWKLVKVGAPTATATPTPAPAPAPVPAGAARHRVTRGALVDPNATPEAKALASYLYDRYGTSVLSGQWGTQDVQWVTANTGKSPAVAGFDLMDYSPSRVAYGATSHAVEDLIAWDQRGGIATLCWHWNAPDGLINKPGGYEWWSGFYTWASTFDIQYALANPSSQQYQDLIRDIDAIAVQLKRIQAAHVPVIFRPLHEAEGGWFWWGAKGPGPAKQLYALLYDRITRYHGIHNLIWDWNSVDPSWYPGNATVDMVSADSYPAGGDHTTQAATYNNLLNLTGDTKIAALSETGAIPDPAALQAGKVDYSWFATWNGFESDQSQNALSFLRTVYTNPYVVTLDKLPNVHTYR